METFSIEVRTLEHHQLERRFAAMRLPDARALEVLMRSLARAGQLQALIAVPDAGTEGEERFVLLDGYRRLEALHRLGQDTARVALWHCALAEALPLVLARTQARAWAPVEEALVLRALAADYGLSQHELARRTGRDVSWVNRRLKLLSALSEELLQAVCRGQLSTWAAARILAPLARANETHAHALLGVLASQPLSTRELSRWYRHYTQSNRTTREHLVAHPHLFIATLDNENTQRDAERLRDGPEGEWVAVLERIEGRLKRLRRALPKLCAGGLAPELALALNRTRAALPGAQVPTPSAPARRCSTTPHRIASCSRTRR